MKHPGTIAALVLLAAVTSAHIGSPNTYYEGRAGPYPLRVIVRSPGVVPGLAEITVRVLAGHPSQIAVLPIFWDPRTQAPPPPDIAQPVRGDSSLYTAALWLMRSGAYSVRVSVSGPAGPGTVLVPVQAVATQRLELRPSLGIALAALGLLLFAGAVTAARGAARESVLEPGQLPDHRADRRGRVATIVSAVVLALLLLGARAWWRAVDAAYRTGLYRPAHIALSTRTTAGARVLRFTLGDDALHAERAFQWTPLIPEHGHLVHLFLVRDSSLTVFAHLHPVPVDSVTFETPLPSSVPAGPYRAYADVVHETGFAQTLTGTVTIEAAMLASRSGDPDDAVWTASRRIGADSAQLDDGSIMIWERRRSTLLTDSATSLRFRVVAKDGRPVVLEPYMGMAGHLMLTTPDGAVFVHLHPEGTISVASQRAFQERQPGDTVRGALARRMGEPSMPAMASTASDSVVSFFYAFPKPGHYRLWVEVKHNQIVLTGAFDADVTER